MVWPEADLHETCPADGPGFAEVSWFVGECCINSYIDLLSAVRQLKHFSDNQGILRSSVNLVQIHTNHCLSN